MRYFSTHRLAATSRSEPTPCLRQSEATANATSATPSLLASNTSTTPMILPWAKTPGDIGCGGDGTLRIGLYAGFARWVAETVNAQGAVETAQELH